MTKVLQDDISICFGSSSVTAVPFAPGDVPEGLSIKPLRLLEDGTLSSGILEIPSGWSSSDFLIGSNNHQGFVLNGDLSCGKQILGANAFFFTPANDVFPPISSRNGARVLMIFGSKPDYKTVNVGELETKLNKGTLVITDSWTIEPIVPIIDGTPVVDFQRRVLWQDPISGCDTRLLKVPAGFEGRGPNWHPVNEEIFCIEGDIGPDDTKLLKPGWYLHNPAYGIHGYHEHSKNGAVVLEWHDGPWSINFI